MNKNINKSGLRKQTFAVGILIFLVVVCLSGCTDTQNTDSILNNFIGTWAGSVEVSTFGGPIGGNSTFTKLTFTQDNIVAVTRTDDLGTNIMNYTYVVNGNNLVLKPSFFGGGIRPDRQPFNGTQQPFNGTDFPDGPSPFNGTKPPSNNTEPFNHTWPSNGEQPSSMSLSFLYSFDENYTVLYLNGSKFMKIQ